MQKMIASEDLNVLFFFNKFRYVLLGKPPVIGHYPEGLRKIISLCWPRKMISLCYAPDMLFASHKSKVYCKSWKAAGKCQKFIWKKLNTLIVDLDKSKAVLIIVIKQIFDLKSGSILERKVSVQCVHDRAYVKTASLESTFK